MYYEIIKFDPVNNYYCFTSEELDEIKQTISESSLKQFIEDMAILFNLPLESVTDKQMVPPSGDIHDYASLATYWWPNPETENGLPYVQRDGEANPDGVNYDKDKLRRLAYLVYHAGLLYFLTEDDKYYQLLKKHLLNWFDNETTRMNPNMNFGQFIPGKSLGRPEGIIDYAANFTFTLQLLTVLHEKSLIDEELTKVLKNWHEEFIIWLDESEIGLKEKASKNNHGTMYDLTRLVIYQFLGKSEKAVDLARSFVEFRINPQIEPDGSLPLETRRTKSKNYTFMGLKGMLDFAKLIEKENINLWDSKIKLSVNWLYDLVFVKQDWPYQQITQFDDIIYLLFQKCLDYGYPNEYKTLFKIENLNIINKVPMYLFSK